MTTRRSRAADTQRIAADYARTHGWPYAQANGAGAPGRDILGMPGLAPEVKARRDFSLTGSLNQAVRNSGGDLPFVICRPDGYGPASVSFWPVVLRYADLIDLLRAAGYGDPPEKFEDLQPGGRFGDEAASDASAGATGGDSDE